jgi:hypothetical protein
MVTPSRAARRMLPACSPLASTVPLTACRPPSTDSLLSRA